MSEVHTIPDHVATRVARLINEAEDMRQQAADDLKQIYADLREELRGMGWVGSAVSAEVAALKGAISELRLDDEKKAKREEKGERVDDYVSMLSRARAHTREASFTAEPADAAVTAGNDLREPVAAGQGQIVREGDAPRETGRQEDSDDCRTGGVASSPDTELPETATRLGQDVQSPRQCTSAPENLDVTAGETAPLSEAEVPAFLRKDASRKSPADFRPNCLNPEACAASGLGHCYACRKAMETAEIQAA